MKTFRRCKDCGVGIGPRATRCKPCAADKFAQDERDRKERQRAARGTVGERATETQRRALIWIAEHEPTGVLDETAPGHNVRSLLERKGWIMRAVPPTYLVKRSYQLTAAGRKAMTS